jgi:hypothetical protein
MNTPGPYEVLHIGAEPAYLGDGGHTRRIAERQRDLLDTFNRMYAQGYRFLETRGEFAIFKKRIMRKRRQRVPRCSVCNDTGRIMDLMRENVHWVPCPGCHPLPTLPEEKPPVC